MKNAIAYIDGSGNSGRIQACAVSLHLGGIVYERTQILPPHTSNNFGEYSGLLLCLSLAKKLGVAILQIRSDSQLIVNQTTGKWRCRDLNLEKLRNQVWKEAQGFSSLSISWIPREENQRADALCREAIKKHQAAHRIFARPRPPFLSKATS